MKKADRADEQAVPADPAHGRAADACAARLEEAAPSGFRGKNLRLLNTKPEQLARVLLRGGANPRPKARKTAAGE